MGLLISILVMAVIIGVAYYLLISRREDKITPRDREILRERDERSRRGREERPGPRPI